MPEVANAGEDHGYAEPVGGGDDVLILYRSARLNHGSCSRCSHRFKTIRKGKESV